MDLLLVNLAMMGYIDRDLTRLYEYAARCRVAGSADSVQLPGDRPDAFRTATGVHAGGRQGVPKGRPA